MTREILFRGKRVDNGGWVEGYYAVKGKDTDLEKHFIVTSTFDSNTNAYPFYFTDNWVEPETVCQYTGLSDKSGKRFEGDIFQASDGDYMQRYIITWNEYALEWSAECIGNPEGTLPLCEFSVGEIEVIGNEFDNPELIGE